MLLLVDLSAAPLLAATMAAASFPRDKMLASRVDKLRSIVETMSGLAKSLEDEVAEGRMDARRSFCPLPSKRGRDVVR